MLFELIALGMGPTTNTDTQVTTYPNGTTLIEKVPTSPEEQTAEQAEMERRKEIMRAAGEPVME